MKSRVDVRTYKMYNVKLTEKEMVALLAVLGSTTENEDMETYETAPKQELFEDKVDFAEVVYELYDDVMEALYKNLREDHIHEAMLTAQNAPD